ncbi:tetraspanin-31-B isoform X1 [Coccinella septempunctata]|uniref:tetraspanin-31-B isoform X1 n=1 Tax=Coccinella septempunctata TaxID=41139 RepID=UPI001D092D1D|nr:tetraspanin-31-B isoform X1 [Coccinella septempunctata]
MCGGFTCSKNSLIALNILYILVGSILISVAVYGRAASVVSNLPIVGVLIACGIILIMISMLGLLGAIKHHQVMLFFYMVILFLLFLLQFSVACACLGVNTEQQEQMAEQGWNKGGNSTRIRVQDTFTCCGFSEQIDKEHAPPKCEEELMLKCCPDPNIEDCKCPKCMNKLRSTISYAFKLCGWIGLFFSFTEIIGLVLTRRYRNQTHPDLYLKATAVFPRSNFTY